MRRAFVLQVVAVGGLVAGAFAALDGCTTSQGEFEERAARLTGAAAVSCEQADSSQPCRVVDNDGRVALDGCDAFPLVLGSLAGCSVADPSAELSPTPRWWPMLRRLDAQGVEARLSVAVERNEFEGWAADVYLSAPPLSGETRGEAMERDAWILVPGDGAGATTPEAAFELMASVDSDVARLRRGALRRFDDGTTVWIGPRAPSELRTAALDAARSVATGG